MDVQKAPLHTPSLEEVAKGDVVFSLSSICSETIVILYYRPPNCTLISQVTRYMGGDFSAIKLSVHFGQHREYLENNVIGISCKPNSL